MENISEKRLLSEPCDIIEEVKAIIFSLSGAISSGAFLKEQHSPYVKLHLKSYLESHWETDEVQADIDLLRQSEEVTKADSDSAHLPAKDLPKEEQLPLIEKAVIWHLDNNTNNASLQQLTGHILREGYKTGKLTADTYEDVATALKEWHTLGKRLVVFDSFAADVQKAYLSHTSDGDLLELFSGCYDLNNGAKDKKQSYVKIAELVGFKPDEFLFLSDLTAEVAAATEAGMKTCIVSRDGDDSLSDEDLQKHLVVESLCELMREEFENGEGPYKKIELGHDGDEEDESNEGPEDSNQGAEEGAVGDSAEDVSE